MERYVAFLRGINLGNRRIKNDELRAQFERLGLAEVATFRASGNVIFAADSAAEDAVAAEIEAGLEKGLGYDVAVFLRSAGEVVEIADREPFDAKLVETSKGKLQVLFLGRKPTAKARRTALALASDEDRLEIAGRELFWLPSGGISDSELDLKAIDRVLGKGTMRTKGTIDQIAAKHCQD
jgi:uncharacterized protein (DUF1697 family)